MHQPGRNEKEGQGQGLVGYALATGMVAVTAVAVMLRTIASKVFLNIA